MKEASVKEELPFEAWSKLIEQTMSSYTVTQTTESGAQSGGEDPWATMIDRLWELVRSAIGFRLSLVRF